MESTRENVQDEEEAQLILNIFERDLEYFGKIYGELTGTYIGKTETFEDEKDMFLKELREMISSVKSHTREIRSSHV